MKVRKMTTIDAMQLALIDFDGGPPILNEPNLWFGINESQDELHAGILYDENTQQILGAVIAEYGEHDLTLVMLVMRIGCCIEESYATALQHLKSQLNIQRNRIVAPIPVGHSRSNAWKSALSDEGFTSWGAGIHDGIACELLVFQHFPTVNEWMAQANKD